MDEDECAICTDPLCHAPCAALPGCGHRFHTHCIMNFSQRDVRCPICRQTPAGVVVARAEPEVFTFSFDDVVQDVQTVVDVQRRAWQRYRNRRRRALNAHPHLRCMYERLVALRQTLDADVEAVQRAYARQCREVWKRDPDIAAQRAAIARSRRRERRLERTLCEELRALIGSEPDV